MFTRVMLKYTDNVKKILYLCIQSSPKNEFITKYKYKVSSGIKFIVSGGV